jgi:hypothetical protein
MPLSRSIFIAVWALLLSVRAASAQGTMNVTFDGPPLQPPSSDYTLQYYSESGVWFTPVPGTDGFGRMGSTPPAGWPDDGTSYVHAALGDSLMFGLGDGSSFDPVSVNLAEYSDIVRSPVTVHFVGYRQDGTVVTDDITTAGIFNGVAPVFTNFTFDPGFSGLVRVEIPTIAWSLDNLTLRRDVPEPRTAALVGVAAALLGVRLFKREGRP